jgi:hypothetical protein
MHDDGASPWTRQRASAHRERELILGWAEGTMCNKRSSRALPSMTARNIDVNHGLDSNTRSAAASFAHLPSLDEPSPQAGAKFTCQHYSHSQAPLKDLECNRIAHQPADPANNRCGRVVLSR